MRTDELIEMLANQTDPVESDVLPRRYGLAVGCGGLGAVFLMVLLLGVRGDIGNAVWLPMFWVKLAFPGVLLGAGILASARLAMPGVPLGLVYLGVIAPVLVIWALSAIELLGVPSDARPSLIMGNTAAACPWRITLLSVPLFAAMLWGMRGLAPTRLVAAGAAAGLTAGAGGALVYALHCPEMAASFIGLWYLLGMLIPAAAGAIAGRWVLRW